MRIAQIAPLTESVPPRLYGGTERVVSFLTEQLVDMGHDVTLFASGDSRTSAELAAVWPTALRFDAGLRDAFAPQGLSIYQANGTVAGQTVFHFHMHLVPRYENDGMNLTWPVKNPPREQLEASAAKIRASLR